MDNKVRPIQMPPAPDVNVIANIGGKNAILWILTGDLVGGYKAVTDWIEFHKLAQWVILSMNVNPVQLNSPIQGANVTGFGITVVLVSQEWQFD
jgi:hypothetical protein